MNNSDIVYKGMLEKKLQDITKRINHLEKENHGIRAITDGLAEDIGALKRRQSDLKEEIENFEKRDREAKMTETVLDKLDEYADNKDKKVEEIQDEIKELRELQSQLQTRRHKRKIERTIKAKNKKIKSLKKKKGYASKVQRTIMMPRAVVHNLRDRVLAQGDSVVDLAQQNITDVEALQAMLNPEENALHAVQNAMLDVKKTYYTFKRDISKKINDALHSKLKPVKVEGAKPTKIDQAATERIRQQFDQRVKSTPLGLPGPVATM